MLSPVSWAIVARDRGPCPTTWPQHDAEVVPADRALVGRALHRTRTLSGRRVRRSTESPFRRASDRASSSEACEPLDASALALTRGGCAPPSVPRSWGWSCCCSPGPSSPWPAPAARTPGRTASCATTTRPAWIARSPGRSQRWNASGAHVHLRRVGSRARRAARAARRRPQAAADLRRRLPRLHLGHRPPAGRPPQRGAAERLAVGHAAAALGLGRGARARARARAPPPRRAASAR